MSLGLSMVLLRSGGTQAAQPAEPFGLIGSGSRARPTCYDNPVKCDATVEVCQIR